MSAITVRNLSDDTHRALRVRAAQNGRSTEAEVRSILDEAVRPAEKAKLGALLSAIGLELGGVDLEVARDTTPIDPARFE